MFGQHKVSYDRFSGSYGLLTNPALIANSPKKLDIHILSNFTTVANTVSDIDYSKIIDDLNINSQDVNYLIDNNFTISSLDTLYQQRELKNYLNYFPNYLATTSDKAIVHSTIMGPSFVYAINSRHSIGAFSALKLVSYFNNFNIDLITREQKIETLADLTDFMNNNIKGYGNSFSWYEYGLSYAFVAYHEYDKMLKFGVSLKQLRGIKYASFNFIEFNNSLSINQEFPKKSTVDVTGKLILENNNFGSNIGYGVDLGFVFEKNRERNHSFYIAKRNRVFFNYIPYSYRLAVSLTNIGYLTFNKVKKEENQVHYVFPNQEPDFSEYFKFNSTTKPTKETYILPTTLHLNYDHYLGKSVFLNTNLDVRFANASNVDQIYYPSNLSVGLRFEKRFFTLATDINYDSLQNLRMESYLRLGSFFVRTSQLLSNFKETFYYDSISLGIRVPFLN
ncbi:hypothetical protein [Ochrovirga pacifica]|uniref:hypothetical protein n=1 Tax=Ochrovirga pacifica TaxID=1042376 RepID=UPI000255951E|nr:hypothetical protein [Ochrovirga pacifica]